MFKYYLHFQRYRLNYRQLYNYYYKHCSLNIYVIRFDSETLNLMNDLRQEKVQRERLAREKEIAIAEKFTIEQHLSVSISTYMPS